MRHNLRPYLGRMSFTMLLSDMPPAYATAVTVPMMMQMEVVEGDEDGGRCKEQVVGGGEKPCHIYSARGT
jgi:hypothetical protein